MHHLQTHGTPQYSIAVIHGGPGAAGEMAPVARALAPSFGILEPLQTATTLDGQVSELASVLQSHAQPPVTLIGHSWGAWLSFIVAAHHPILVKKLILIGCPPFEERYAAQIQSTRLSRLTTSERREYESILQALTSSVEKKRDEQLARLGALCRGTDNYHPVPDANEAEQILNAEIFRNVWEDAAEMRRNGELVRLASKIECPVVAIHGDYDPHPAEGVERPLRGRVKDLRMMVIENCGHSPWIEQDAREMFFRVVREILRG